MIKSEKLSVISGSAFVASIPLRLLHCNLKSHLHSSICYICGMQTQTMRLRDVALAEEYIAPLDSPQ